ncbi:MAG: rhodanese-like domain-containing protein [Lachnospiraceae bacterium]
MKKGWILCGIFLLLLAGCKRESGEPEQFYRVMTDYEELTALLNAPKEDMVLLDLRDNRDYEKAHLTGSINVPFDDEGTWLLQCVEEHSWKKNIIYLICAGGKRSAAAFNLLAEQGAPRIVYISFGYEEYIESQGYETSEGAEVCDCYHRN